MLLYSNNYHTQYFTLPYFPYSRQQDITRLETPVVQLGPINTYTRGINNPPPPHQLPPPPQRPVLKGAAALPLDR